jgi:hypothetical protein
MRVEAGGESGLAEVGVQRTLRDGLWFAILAFAAGVLLDARSGQADPFDRVVYPVLTLALLVLQVTVSRIPALSTRVITALVQRQPIKGEHQRIPDCEISACSPSF